MEDNNQSESKYNFKELFSNPLIFLPIRKEKSDFLKISSKYQKIGFSMFIQKILDEYSSILEYIGIENEKIVNISREMVRFLITLEEYLKGNVSDAYDTFKDCMSFFNEHFSNISFPENQNFILYRARKRDSPLEEINDSNQMKHIPFQLRHLVKTQRYSIPGVPCLYVGESSYVCWLELERPDFNDFFVIDYQLDKKAKILDFSWRPQAIYAYLKSKSWKIDPALENKLLDYIYCWPIIMACSIIWSPDDAPFKIEYVFPQFFMQWIKNENPDYAGVKYFSVKNENISLVDFPAGENIFLNTERKCINYAFPIIELKDFGFCNELEKILHILEGSKPISYQKMIMKSSQEELINIQNNESSTQNDKKIMLFDNSIIDYKNSLFGQLENALEYLRKIQKSEANLIRYETSLYDFKKKNEKSICYF